jgi:hypothetical protein
VTARVEREIAVAQVERRCVASQERRDCPAVPLGAVNAVVQPPCQAVHEHLAVEPIALIAEPGEHDLPDISHAVAIPIFQVDEIRLEADGDTAVVGDHRRGIAQAIREDAAFVEAAVAVGVFQQPDAADALVEHQVGARLGLIPAHLDNVEAAVLVERHLNRIDDHGLVRDELEAEALPDAERVEHLVRLDGRNVGHVLRIDLEAEREVRLTGIQVSVAGVRPGGRLRRAWRGLRLSRRQRGGRYHGRDDRRSDSGSHGPGV